MLKCAVWEVYLFTILVAPLNAPLAYVGLVARG